MSLDPHGNVQHLNREVLKKLQYSASRTPWNLLRLSFIGKHPTLETSCKKEIDHRGEDCNWLTLQVLALC